MSKMEERVKIILTEFYDKKEKNIENIIIERSLGIFIWGFIVGALFSYISILPFLIGLLIGISIVKNNPLMLNTFIDKFFDIIHNGKTTIFEKFPSF